MPSLLGFPQASWNRNRFSAPDAGYYGFSVLGEFRAVEDRALSGDYMIEEDQPKAQVEAFIRDHIDSVPHMEALLLLWNHRPQARTIEQMASALFVSGDLAKKILHDLMRQSLLEADAGTPQRYSYAAGSAYRDRLLADVAATYRRELVRLTGIIHAKGSQAAREFAEAFRFTKDKEGN